MKYLKDYSLLTLFMISPFLGMGKNDTELMFLPLDIASYFCFCNTSVGIGVTLTTLFLLFYIRKQRKGKQKLNASFEAKKDMLANISHDLKTPVAIIQGYTETILMKMETASEEDKERFLNIILENTEKLNILTSQLSEYSKLDAHQIKLKKEAFSITDLVEQTKQEYKVLAEKKKINLSIEYAEDTAMVMADIFLIKRVIQNLLDNALTYSPNNGEIIIRVSNKQDQVKVEIVDSGPGISDVQQALIFERHQKDKNSRGAGLGLSIVKKILDLHQSVIQVQSQLGEGTCFIFSLPAHRLS